MRRIGVIAALTLAAANPAAGEVTAVTPSSFVIEHSVTLPLAQAAAWELVRSPQLWWDPEHSYSGNAANLYLDAQATGCFCERMPDKGSIEHLHIVYIAPGQMIRLTGALGPLQAEAVSGTFVLKLARAGADATKVTLSYVVGGYMRQGGEALAPAVDKVLGVQIARLEAVARRPVTPPPAK